MRIFKLVCLAVALAIPACLPANGSFGGHTFTRVETTAAPAVPVHQEQGPAYDGRQPGVDNGIYFNGVRLNQQQIGVMMDILQEDFIPAGRYYIHANGDMGLEGQAPLGNIIPYVEAFKRRHGGDNRTTNRGGTDVVINSTGGVGTGTLVGNGNCMTASIPGMSISSGC